VDERLYGVGEIFFHDNFVAAPWENSFRVLHFTAEAEFVGAATVVFEETFVCFEKFFDNVEFDPQSPSFGVYLGQENFSEVFSIVVRNFKSPSKSSSKARILSEKVFFKVVVVAGDNTDSVLVMTQPFVNTVECNVSIFV
jgi:hypothetical protein